MLLSEYKLDILSNLFTRFPIILALLTILLFLVLFGIYYELNKIRGYMKVNNELLKEISDKSINRKSEE